MIGDNDWDVLFSFIKQEKQKQKTKEHYIMKINYLFILSKYLLTSEMEQATNHVKQNINPTKLLINRNKLLSLQKS